MTNTINSDSYAQYDVLDSLSYLCIKYLMDNDELVWKLLFYNDPTAWNKPNLTNAQKSSLIYNGEDDSSSFRIFMDTGEPDAFTKEVAIIRIHPYTVNPDNRVWGSVTMMLEAYSHYHINHLSNYKTRNDMIIKRFIQVFNGAEIGGIGLLHFDAMGTFGNRMDTQGQAPYKGKWLLMGNKVA